MKHTRVARPRQRGSSRTYGRQANYEFSLCDDGDDDKDDDDDDEEEEEEEEDDDIAPVEHGV
jgi:hypothetical protein